MSLNMELGVLIRGSELPGQVRVHFERLIGAGVLRRVGLVDHFWRGTVQVSGIE